MAAGRDLFVDPVVHVNELARFRKYCVSGPGESCCIFTGAIGDDGYGRFWVGRPTGPQVVRAHRFAVAAATGRISGTLVAMHECDNPICVRVGAGHVVEGTQSDNLAAMASKQRGGGSGSHRGFTGLDRTARHARAVAIRSAVANGWDGQRVREALGMAMPGQQSLFEMS